METYFTSAEGVMITRRRALAELRRHGLCHKDDFAAFFAECGVRKTYHAQRVLRWLGY